MCATTSHEEKKRNRLNLKRTTPLKRTPFISIPKPPKGPRPKKCKNRACRTSYIPDPSQPWKDWCSVDCGTVLAIEKLAKQKAAKEKSERAEAKRRKEQGMSIRERLAALQVLVNRYVVLRDKDENCISCPMPAHYDGAWHASHFKSVGSNSNLRFNLLNIHKGCAQCNLFKSGNIAEYEKRLRLKIGDDRVEWLKTADRSRVYDHDYLIRFSIIMRRKIKRLEKRRGSSS